MGPSRRALLKAGLAAATLLAVPSAGIPRRPGDPFTLGVASGEPAPDGMVLWTRLAPDPFARDGLGGMGGRHTDVEWQLAEDEQFRRVVRSGVHATSPELGHSVHVEVEGLAPGREYFYRFRAGTYISPSGRTRTAPEPTAMDALTMCVASCANYEHGFYTAYRRLADEEPDLVLFLGDYIYENGATTTVKPGGTPIVRMHEGSTCRTLAHYRRRYAQYKLDVDLQTAHAAAPWIAVYDDHEVANDWAGDVPAKPENDFRARRAAAFQAYWENMPLRVTATPRGSDMPLYRRARWGALATIHLLDTRQYRGVQPCGDQLVIDCPERTDPARQMLGAAQQQWLAEGFAASTARWDVVGQQVPFTEVDRMPGPDRGFDVDTWDGYPVARDRVIATWRSAGVRNPVVLSGDAHNHWAVDIHARGDDPDSPKVGVELVTTSVSSDGDGSESRSGVPEILQENPQVRFFNSLRGYIWTRWTADELRSDFRVLPYVHRPGAPVQTRASFVVADRLRGLNPV